MARTVRIVLVLDPSAFSISNCLKEPSSGSGLTDCVVFRCQVSPSHISNSGSVVFVFPSDDAVVESLLVGRKLDSHVGQVRITGYHVNPNDPSSAERSMSDGEPLNHPSNAPRIFDSYHSFIGCGVIHTADQHKEQPEIKA